MGTHDPAADAVLPKPEEKKQYVRAMFDGVASKYDFLNHLLSLGIDIYWRRRALKLINFSMNPKLLDLATGTGDVAIMAVRMGAQHVYGVDLSEGMLAYGRKKIEKEKMTDAIDMICGEGERIPMEDACVDASTIAFGIRNVVDIPQTLREMARVTKTSGMIVVLEFSQPQWPVMKQLYQFYFTQVLPRIGSLFSKDKKAYHYLPASVMRFPARDEFAQMMEQAGYTNVRHFDMTLGIVTVYSGIKL